MKRKMPAYPLFLKCPNFSFWSVSDCLNESTVKSWYGADKPMYGFLKVNGETYCFLGNGDEFLRYGIKKAEQTDVKVTSFTTDYTFQMGDVCLKVSFVSPLPLDDLDLLSLPVCYMEYEVIGAQDVEISFFINKRVNYNVFENVYNYEEQYVRACVMPMENYEDAVIGLQRQLYLSHTDDKVGADWGYYHLTGERAYVLDEKDVVSYLLTGNTEFGFVGRNIYIGSVNQKTKGVIMLGYDEIVSINYFGDFKKGWYLENHTINEALRYVYEHRSSINEKLEKIDRDLIEKAKDFGDKYYDILTASMRQSIAGHKLIRGKNGKPLFLSKECGSNGCIATVDVSYPSIPLYLLYNAELVKGMMQPILEFAKMPVWEYDFAPHDVGTYPACTGQVYGLKSCNSPDITRYNATFTYHNGTLQTNFPLYVLPSGFDAYKLEMQMPVEECANMLIMFYACYKKDGDISFFKDNFGLCNNWVQYLVKYGLKPENQLCTDDFAGHLANNLNLAIKATVGIACFAGLAKALGNEQDFINYRSIAEKYALEITEFGGKYTHLPITWDTDDSTFSLKYNFAFDKVLGLNLFPLALYEKEIDCYLSKVNEFGTPLDSRKEYTKSDWITWTATLTSDNEKRKKLIEPLQTFLKKSPSRVPFSDWFETKTGAYHHFIARTVQGGCFILLLLNEGK